ncbi:cold shock domain-containing protein [Marinifilum sp. N1E240]|uniref:cold-shock protein n=1 Tax=Marinifilum sp. N1E240 TaxID=2608082 RepID=UPI00128C665C|nr:cold shock domain-containing protein [Marinifilum sp. N1E240]MPQ47294.1 cold shock domain-containing protein [Marinifilum sp. N1E240]|eukprot:gnl/Carplike_NY0171/5_a8_31949.p1 GENE.gnl/Carplike_NY0171/5_a8_31949~~gnl/Carplike_NY0171/5_a8_31949.p1  ORF type:complete len:153 (-),score=47.46 gnl/Carplike_NY0171/5_a8_31949:121-579(-)
MARSQETYNKKEKEKRKLQKRKEKEARKEARKESGGGKSFEDMIAYTDEFGNITSTPPDPNKKKEEINVEDIVLGARNSGDAEEEAGGREGIVSFFNDSKGYGFIKDLVTKESVFVHVNGLVDHIKENDKVTYETERGPKGMNAVNVTLIKK